MKCAPSLSERIRSRFGSNFFISLKALVALFVLFLPAVFAVICANRFADSLYGPMAVVLEPALSAMNSWPSLLAALFAGNY